MLTFGRTRRTGVECIDLAETIEGFGGMLRQVVGSKIAVEFDWARNADGARVSSILADWAL